MKDGVLVTLGGLGVLGIWIASIAGFVQHVVTCINEEMVMLLVIGVIFPPIGVLHGWFIWLGAFS